MATGAQPPGAATSPSAQPPGDHERLSEDASMLAEEGAPELLPSREPWRSLFRTIGVLERAIGTVLIVVILVLVLIQVAQRYVPGGGWPWTGEVARLALVWCTFILSGYLMARDRHIEIQVVDLVLRPRALAMVKLMAHALVGVTCVAMAFACYHLIADDRGQRTPAAEIPLAWTYVIPMVGFVLTALRAGLAISLIDAPGVARRRGGADG
jgi:TRAP-type transport system small permease protein